ncbi:ATP-binding cassette subfamily C member 4-like [Oppia nitens]|uniref:ATP-binding cassette subfamily C member 4-like n=1 Tax=Oppia nitens TaxID=1686743 RepID=UPI0023DBD488|nr:ATP-binding cassette subfamily C member 4-like [Oppia nitens]
MVSTYMTYTAVLETVIRVSQPILLGYVIDYFSNNNTIDYKNACLAALGVCLCSLLFISLHHPTLVLTHKIGMKMRIASCALMYKKSLRLSQASLGKTTIGQIVNMMSNDVNRFDEFSTFICYIILAPIQTIIIVYIAWTHLGWSTLVGVAILILFIPFQGIMGKLFSRVRQKTAEMTDNRLRLMNEIIGGMRVIKMYSWEQSFTDLVANARKLEVNFIKKSCFLKAINLSVFFVASRIILFACFITYVLTGNILTAKAVFVTMALFNTLRITLTLLFPNAVTQLAELSVSCQRIQTFLELEELNVKSIDNQNHLKSKELNNESISVSIDNIIANWSNENPNPTLHNISVNLKCGDLLAVIGPVGSGKSSFLMSILGELPVQSGTIQCVGSISYASQEPWNFNNSVRNNILFGNEYNESRYKRVVNVCALDRDFTIFPFGDRTLVGEKGVSLSGGQKARITLARALYRNSDIVLMDDPLSAVDSSVAEHIFDKCIVDHLSDKIRILVTHQIQFIRKATQILVLNEGKCLAMGTFDELQAQGVDFMTLLKEQEKENADKKAEIEKQERERELIQSLTQSGFDERVRSLSRSVSITGGSIDLSNILVKLVNNINDNNRDDPKIKDEERQVGSIEGRVYWEYIKAGTGPLFAIFTILSTLISQTIFHGSDIWLTEWTNKNQMSGHIVSTSEQNIDAYIYSGLIGLLFLTALMRAISWFTVCMRASINLHNTIFYRLLRAPISIFDNNPVGRILNRFTKDLGVIDEMLPSTSFDLNVCLAQGVGIAIVVGIVNPYLIIPAIVMFILIVIMRGIYIKSARDIKRFEGATRSPVFTHVSTTLTGLASVRAYGAQDVFEKQYYIYQNDHSATWFLFVAASRGLGWIMDWFCVLYIIAIAVVLMLSPNGIAGGTAGLALSSALMLTGMTAWGVRQSAEMESQMTSVERIVEYSRLPQEAPLEANKQHKPRPEWPDCGRIQFKNMYLFYESSNKPVLKNLCCSIKSAEKIGIVGRTGAGKSSIISALFRMVEPKGQILIDGIDTKSIGLHDLRKKISIIPQDPVVFTGTVRRNLDPFGEYSDEQIWKALDEVQLKHAVQELRGELDAELSEGGSNFSVGQRQLVCLARAILRSNRVLVLDEATANVDHQTDSLIQTTIRNKFSDCTVLTIAHRLNTIIDSHRVLVLDAGEIIEFDTPLALLQRKGKFYDMCRKTGKDMFNHLMKMAKEIHFHKFDTNEEQEEGQVVEYQSDHQFTSHGNNNDPQKYGTFQEKF